MGISCPDEAPLLALVSLVAPAIAMGNRVVVTPSPVHPLVATDFYQVLDTSDVPAGVVNIVTGDREALAKTIAEHDDIAAYWYFGTKEGSAMVEARLGRQSQGDLGQSRPRGRLVERRRRPGPPLPSPRHAGEEHLGALRRIALCSPLISTWQERMGARSTAAISTEDKVRFLSAPEAYPAKPAEVEVRETHWSLRLPRRARAPTSSRSRSRRITSITRGSPRARPTAARRCCSTAGSRVMSTTASPAWR